jgi:hypothetical protein
MSCSLNQEKITKKKKGGIQQKINSGSGNPRCKSQSCRYFYASLNFILIIPRRKFFIAELLKFWLKILVEQNFDYFCSRVQKNIGPVVQLVRIPACHAGGREFESRPDRLLAKASICRGFFLP